MTVPDYQSLMLPVLKIASQGEIRISDAVEKLASELRLTEQDRAELLPSGKQTTFSNRVHWAKTYLKQAGLVEPTRRAHFKITPRGSDVLSSNIPRIDIGFLNRFPEFQAFRAGANNTDDGEAPAAPQFDKTLELAQTPDDQIRSAAQLIHDTLGREIIDRILSAPPSFFERAIVSLLLAMGYGGTAKEAGRAIGRAGDDGVDGVID